MSSVEDLLQKSAELYAQDRFDDIIALLSEDVENAPFPVGLELARAYINSANARRLPDGDDLYAMANALLDKYASDGIKDPAWLFYKGYALFKLGLVNDAALRFEIALKHIKIGSQDSLFTNINRMLALCRSIDPDNHANDLSPEDAELLDRQIREHFGSYRILFKTDRYELLHFAPDDEHPFHLICTKGLSGKKLNVPAGVDPMTDSRLELCVCLPLEWEFNNTEDYNLWPVNTLCRLANFVLSTDDFIGFGHTFSDGRVLHPSTAFTGGMLTAPGHYDKSATEARLSDGSVVHFFELVFLYPVEIAFRQTHQAVDLLERFAARKVLPSPVRNRPDVCVQVDASVSAEKI